jgi:hypothetical protein
MKDKPRLFTKKVQNCSSLCPGYAAVTHAVHGEFRICKEYSRIITTREGFPDFCKLKEIDEAESPTG